MSQILSDLKKKYPSFPILLLNDNIVMLSPLSRTSRIVDILTEFSKDNKDGNETINDDKEKIKILVDILINNPNLIYFGGIGYIIDTITPLNVIDMKIESEVINRVKDELIKTAESDNKNLLYGVMNEFYKLPLMENGKISKMDFIRQNISFIIEDFVDFNGKKFTGVFAVKYVPCFRIRFIDLSDKTKRGVWQLDECVIGVNIYMLNKKLVFTKTPVIIYPNKYHHPYVFEENNGICTGTMKLKAGEKEIQAIDKMPFMASIYHYITQISYLITNGFYSGTTPAQGSLIDDEYKENKIFNSIEDEAKHEISEIKNIWEEKIKSFYESMKRLEKIEKE